MVETADHGYRSQTLAVHFHVASNCVQHLRRADFEQLVDREYREGRYSLHWEAMCFHLAELLREGMRQENAYPMDGGKIHCSLQWASND